MLTDNEHQYCTCHKDLYAAVRSERPPDVTTAPYAKAIRTSKGKQSTGPSSNKRVITRTHIGEINPAPAQVNNTVPAYQQMQPRQEPMEADIQMEESPKPKKPRTKRTPSEIKYDIVTDALKHRADIEIGDLIAVAPTLQRKLVSGYRPKRSTDKNNTPQQTMALIEDEEFNTTAVYSHIFLGDKKLKALIDCGAAKTYMSKALADELNLEINAASGSIFKLGNGTKQPALGLIYDVPIEVKKGLIMSCTVEVLPIIPSRLIIVFQCIEIANLKLNPEKCHFFKEHLKLIGYTVTKDGIYTDPEKVKKIADYSS